MKYRSLPITIVFLAVTVIHTYGQGDIYKQVRKNQSLMNDVYRYLITNYVDDIDLNEFTKLSINNMLSELDPYTVYMEDEEKEGIELLTKGKYGGVGIQIGKRDKFLTVITPTENSPAKRAGILSGDKIVKIDSIETKNISMDQAAKLIRGKKGTKVILSIQRYGEDDLIEFGLIREDIKVNDISYTGMLDNHTGYIRLSRFSRNSNKEVKVAIQNLLSENMTGLILDLRDNPGGLLNSAVSILDLFTDKGELLVFTEGKTHKSKRKYFSKSEPLLPKDVNISVLVNQGSASASEIIAGTLQDLDRGVVIGRPTYGKGLVQTVFNLDRNRSLKVTTAKYYIPSGRLIQKPGYLPENLLMNPSNNDTIFHTKGGRRVNGMGGIVPDYHVKLPAPEPLLSLSRRNGLFFNFVQKNKMNYQSFNDVENDTNLIFLFEDYLYSSDYEIKMKGENSYLKMKKTLLEIDSTSVQIQGAIDIIDQYFEELSLLQFEKEKDNIKHWLRIEFADFFDGENGKMKIILEKDSDIQTAINILNDPIVYKNIFLPQ